MPRLTESGRRADPGSRVAPNRVAIGLLIAALLLFLVVLTLAGNGVRTGQGRAASPRGGSETTVGPSTEPGTTDQARSAAAGAPPASQADALTSDPSAVMFGVAVSGADPSAIAGLEASLDTRFDLIRVFARWDTEFPNAAHDELLRDGRLVHLSVRPRTDAGEVISWAEVAAAQPGSEIYERLDAWTRAVARYDDQIYFTFNHEPETRQSAGHGSPADFVAAWRRTVDLLRANGGHDTKTVFVTGRDLYETGEIEDWFPGDDVVDIVGVDPYNWFRCQGTERSWASPDSLLAAALAFAEMHDKPLAVPEIASTEDPVDPARKAAWIESLADTLTSPEVAERVEFIAWFSVDDPDWPDCEWRIDSSAEASAALASALARLE